MDQATLDKLNASGSDVSMWEDERLFRGLIYGEPGAGKTHLMGQIFEAIGGKAAIFTTDSNWVVLQKNKEASKLTTRFPFTGFTQMKDFVQAHNEGIYPYSEYRTIGWDTFGTGCDQVLRNLVNSIAFKDQLHRDLEARGHYRLLERLLLELVVDLRASDLNVIYLSHARSPSDQDIQNGRFQVRAAAPGASFNVIAREVQFVGWQYKEDQGRPRKIQLEGTSKLNAKCQIPGIPEKTYNASDIPALIQKWQQEI